jgi:hypothetical protein
LLSAIYEKSTIQQIRAELKVLGGMNNEYFTNRWENFVAFDELESDGDFKVYPPSGVSPDGYKFPYPDKQSFFDRVNAILTDQQMATLTPGALPIGDPQILDFAKAAMYGVMAPLTEIPIVYNRINSSPPVNKPQVAGSSVNMAPMVQITDSSPHTTKFTDFSWMGHLEIFISTGLRK